MVGNPEGAPPRSVCAPARRPVAVAGILEPVYEQLKMARSSRARDPLAVEKDRSAGRCPAIGELHRKAARRRRRSTRTPAFPSIRRRNREGALEALSRWSKTAGPLVVVRSRARPSPRPRSEARARARDQGRAHLRTGRRARAIEFSRRLRSRPTISSAWPRSRRSSPATTPELLDVYRRRIDIANEPDERLKFLFRSRRSKRRC
jgi:hypothetical protein